MYDLSGLTDHDLGVVAADWLTLEARGLTASPAYARHRAHPVVGLWGLGFPDRPITPTGAAALLAGLRRASAPFGGVTLLGGVPAGWRTHDFDASRDAAWDAVYRALDILSPWAVGRYNDERGAPGAHPLNAIPRRCGRFFWAQAYGAVAAGASMLYGAMFDEVDEGTALFKTIPQAARAPTGFLTLDADGCALPDDWYLRLSGAVAAMLRGAAALSPALPFPPP